MYCTNCGSEKIIEAWIKQWGKIYICEECSYEMDSGEIEGQEEEDDES